MTLDEITAALTTMSEITPNLPDGVTVVTATGHEITGKVTLQGNLVRLDSLCTCGKTHQPVFIACEQVAMMRGVDTERASQRDVVRELMARLTGKSDDDEPEGAHHVVDIKRFN